MRPHLQKINIGLGIQLFQPLSSTFTASAGSSRISPTSYFSSSLIWVDTTHHTRQSPGQKVTDQGINFSLRLPYFRSCWETLIFQLKYRLLKFTNLKILWDRKKHLCREVSSSINWPVRSYVSEEMIDLFRFLFFNKLSAQAGRLLWPSVLDWLGRCLGKTLEPRLVGCFAPWDPLEILLRSPSDPLGPFTAILARTQLITLQLTTFATHFDRSTIISEISPSEVDPDF